MGGTPVNRSAGKATKLPPPATEFSAPPSTPAKKRKMADSSVKKLGVSETGPRRQWAHNSVRCVLGVNGIEFGGHPERSRSSGGEKDLARRPATRQDLHARSLPRLNCRTRDDAFRRTALSITSVIA